MIQPHLFPFGSVLSLSLLYLFKKYNALYVLNPYQISIQQPSVIDIILFSRNSFQVLKSRASFVIFYRNLYPQLLD